MWWLEFKEQRQREKGRPVIFEICISSSPESKLRVLNRISRELTEVLPHIRLILFPAQSILSRFSTSSNDPLHLSFIFFHSHFCGLSYIFFAFFFRSQRLFSVTSNNRINIVIYCIFSVKLYSIYSEIS